jgi:hypothetical protein
LRAPLQAVGVDGAATAARGNNSFEHAIGLPVIGRAVKMAHRARFLENSILFGVERAHAFYYN